MYVGSCLGLEHKRRGFTEIVLASARRKSVLRGSFHHWWRVSRSEVRGFGCPSQYRTVACGSNLWSRNGFLTWSSRLSQTWDKNQEGFLFVLVTHPTRSMIFYSCLLPSATVIHIGVQPELDTRIPFPEAAFHWLFAASKLVYSGSPYKYHIWPEDTQKTA